MSPTSRLTWGLSGLALTSFMLLPWIGFFPVALAAGLLLSAALVDGLEVWRRPRPSPVVSAPRIVSQRRPVEIGVPLVGRIAGLLAAPEALGGNAPVIDGRARVVPRQRGLWGLGELWCFETSRLGLWRRRTVADAETTVEVWPDLRDDSESAGLRDRGDGSAVRRGSAHSSLELRGLRPFVNGDDPRHVDWKATARHLHPVVREWEPERRRSVIFALDAGRLMWARHRGESKLDASLRALARVALAAGANGDCVGALAFSSRTLRFIPPLSGRSQAFELLRALNDVQPSLVASDYRAGVPYLLSHRRRALVIVMTDLFDPDRAPELVAAFRELAQVHLPVALLVRDPTASALRERRIDSEDDAYIRASAELLLEDQQQALERLRAHGLNAIEAPMDRLGARALDLYLRSRAHAVW